MVTVSPSVRSPGLFRNTFSPSLTFVLRKPPPGTMQSLDYQVFCKTCQSTDLSRDPIPIRLPVRRPTTSLPELWRNNPRTSRNRNSVPRLWTSLQAMWLLDLREPPAESHRKGKRGYQVKTISAKPSLRQKPQTPESSNEKKR